jgi:hypothetical protein
MPPFALVTPDIDRVEALEGWLKAHLRFASHPDQVVTLEGRASGLLEIHGALQKYAGDVRWFPVQQMLGAPPAAMVKLQVRAGDLADMVGALEQMLAKMRKET